MIPAFRSFRQRLKNPSPRAARFHPSELFLLAALAVFGTAFSLTIPLGAGWDEETHLIRVWDTAHLHFIPGEVSRADSPYPAIYWNLSYRRQLLVHPVEAGFWDQYGAAPMDAQDYLYAEPPTYSRPMHPAPLYLPYAFAFRYLGLKFQLPALTVFFASRLAGLATYALLAWLAVRIAPFGKWVLAVTALAPTTVFQASTIGADPISNGLALLFVSGCLAVSTRKQIGWKTIAGLAGLSVLLFWAKYNLAFLALLPLLILPASRFRMRGGYLLLAGGILILGLVEVGGWSALAFSPSSSAGGTDSLLAHGEYLIKHPVAFVGVIFSDLWEHGPRYLREWVAEYGYGYGSVPFLTYPLFAAAALFAWWGDSGGQPPSIRARRGLLLTFLAGVLGTSLLLYLTLTPVGATQLVGLHGRYYAALAPLLGLATLKSTRRGPGHLAARLAVGFSAASLTVYGAGLFLSYHVPCGTAYYQPGLCYQPVYKNWAPNNRYSQPISPSETLTQEIVSECNGMSEVRVWVDSTGLPENGLTSFSVRDPAADRDLVRQTASNAELEGGSWYVLGFSPEWTSAGRLYLLKIEHAGSSGLEGARVALTLKPEYLAGRLWENELPVDSDVIFQYGCVAGMGKLLPWTLRSELRAP